MPTYRETTLAQLPRLLEILLAHLPDELRRQRIELTCRLCEPKSVETTTETQELSRHEFFHFDRDGEMLGGVFSMLRPDGTVLTLQPAVLPTEPESILQLLYTKLIEYSRAVQAKLAMLLVDYQQTADENMLAEFGFEKVSELLNLNAERAVFPNHCLGQRLKFLPYQEEQWPEMVAEIEKTYEKTLDFPLLTGIVPAEQILRGYQESHIFDPSLWFFIEFQTNIIGALILTQIENTQHIELTYVGLAQEFRGRGFSREIVQFSQFIAKERNGSHLLVSVDANNLPALSSYLHNGFHIHDRKEIFVRFF